MGRKKQERMIFFYNETRLDLYCTSCKLIVPSGIGHNGGLYCETCNTPIEYDKGKKRRSV